MKASISSIEEKLDEIEDHESLEKEIETIKEQHRINLKEIADISESLSCIEKEYVSIKNLLK